MKKFKPWCYSIFYSCLMGISSKIMKLNTLNLLLKWLECIDGDFEFVHLIKQIFDLNLISLILLLELLNTFLDWLEECLQYLLNFWLYLLHILWIKIQNIIFFSIYDWIEFIKWECITCYAITLIAINEDYRTKCKA